MAEKVTAGGLILPENIAGDRQVGFACTICGDEFYDDELAAYSRHVAKCAGRHEQEINEASPRTQVPFLNPENWDTEYEKWVRDHPQQWKAERGIDR